MIAQTPQSLQELLKRRMKRLQAIIDSSSAIPPKDKAPRRTVTPEKAAAAQSYLNELRSLESVFCSFGPVHVLDKTSFKARLKKADFVTIVDEGEFFCLADIANYPDSNYQAIWFKPLDSL